MCSKFDDTAGLIRAIPIDSRGNCTSGAWKCPWNVHCAEHKSNKAGLELESLCMDNLTGIKENKTRQICWKFQSKKLQTIWRIHPLLIWRIFISYQFKACHLLYSSSSFKTFPEIKDFWKCCTNPCIHIYIYSQAYRRGARSKQELTGWHRDQQCGSVCQCCSWQRGWLPRCCYVVSVVLSTGKGAHASPTNPILPTGRSKRTWSSPGDRLNGAV